jgi:hypothetical protein
MTLVVAFTLLLGSCSLALLLLGELLLQVLLPPLLHFGYSHWDLIVVAAAAAAILLLARHLVLLTLPEQLPVGEAIMHQLQGVFTLHRALARKVMSLSSRGVKGAAGAEVEGFALASGSKGLGRCAICLDASATMGLTHKTGNVVHCCLCVSCAKSLFKSGQLKQCVYCQLPVQQLVQVVAS